MAQMVKNLPAMQQTWIRSLGLEDPLEKGTYSCLESLMDRGTWKTTLHRVSELDTTEQLPHFLQENKKSRFPSITHLGIDLVSDIGF